MVSQINWEGFSLEEQLQIRRLAEMEEVKARVPAIKEGKKLTDPETWETAFIATLFDTHSQKSREEFLAMVKSRIDENKRILPSTYVQLRAAEKERQQAGRGNSAER